MSVMEFTDEKNKKKFLSDLVFTYENIKRERLADEPRLLTLKWPDYRFMSPLRATMLFGRLYQDAYRNAIARTVDRKLAQNVRGIDMTRIKSDRRQFTALWTARQHADRLGIRYPEYLEFCFTFATDVKRKRLPQPNQLYFTEASEKAWLMKLDDFWSDRLLAGIVRLEDLPQYRFENFQRLPAQTAFRQFILDWIVEAEKRPHYMMRTFSVEKRQLPIREFVRTLGRERFMDELRKLKDDGRMSPFQIAGRSDISRDHLWQSCFGLRHVPTASDAPCNACPQSRDCQKVTQVILESLKKKHGTTDPLAAIDRARNTERVQKHRQQKKLAAAALV